MAHPSVIAAIIGIPTAIAGAFATAYFTSVFTANAAAEKATARELSKIGIVAAAHINETGNIIAEVGRKIFVSKKSGPYYQVRFSQKLRAKPIILAVSDGGQRGANARVKKANANGFRLEGRSYSANGLVDSGFHFIVFSPNPEDGANVESPRQ